MDGTPLKFKTASFFVERFYPRGNFKAKDVKPGSEDSVASEDQSEELESGVEKSGEWETKDDGGPSWRRDPASYEQDHEDEQSGSENDDSRKYEEAEGSKDSGLTPNRLSSFQGHGS